MLIVLLWRLKLVALVHQVARSDSLLGPYTKHGPPILHNASGAPLYAWMGMLLCCRMLHRADTTHVYSTLPFWAPGHCSVLKLPDSSYAIWYHTYLVLRCTLLRGCCMCLPVASLSVPCCQGKDVPIFSSPRHLMLDTVNWVPSSSDEAGKWPTVDHGADVPSSTSRRVP